MTLTLPGQAAPLACSSSMLELLDYAGTGTSFGFGFDNNGFLFDKITLRITTESYEKPGDPIVQTFSYANMYAPLLFMQSNVSAEVGQTISFPVTVLERDGNSCTLSAVNLPAGAVFSSKLFIWTPTPEQVGSWTVDFEATDGVMTTRKSVQIQVINPAPIFTPVENPVLFELQNLNLQIRAVDLEGNPVPVTASGLPDYAVFNGKTLKWRPRYGDAGTYKVTFSASNEVRREEMTVTIIVLPYWSPSKPILIL